MIMVRSQPIGSSTFAGRTNQHTTRTCKRAFSFPDIEKKKEKPVANKTYKAYPTGYAS